MGDYSLLVAIRDRLWSRYRLLSLELAMKEME